MLLLACAAEAECTAALTPVLPHIPTLPEHEVVSLTLCGGQEVCIVRTGVGPVNAGTALGRALALRRDITAVCCLGLGGSYDLRRAPLGSVWRVQCEIWPEYGLAPIAGSHDPTANAHALNFAQWHRDTHEDTSTVWQTLPLPSVQCWLDRMNTHIDANTLMLLPSTTAITVAAVSNDTTRAAALYRHHDALIENMEGFAVALACARQDIPLLHIRAISNKVGVRTAKHRAFDAALRTLGEFLYNFLSSKGAV